LFLLFFFVVWFYFLLRILVFFFFLVLGCSNEGKLRWITRAHYFFKEEVGIAMCLA